MKLKQYSKKILQSMVVLWFAGAVFGAAVIVIELVGVFNGTEGYSIGLTIHLPELLNYIGMPVGGGIVGYMCKSAFENREKIKQSYIADYNANNDTP